jgi:hypothetical protein
MFCRSLFRLSILLMLVPANIAWCLQMLRLAAPFLLVPRQDRNLPWQLICRVNQGSVLAMAVTQVCNVFQSFFFFKSLILKFAAIGGAVTATTLFIAKADRIAASKRKVIVSFTTSTALNCGDSVSISFPSTFFNLNPLPNGNQQAVASSTGISGPFVVSSAGLNTQRRNMIFTIAVNGNVAAGPQTVTLCGLTLTTAFQNRQCGVSVTTTKDWTTTYAPTGDIGPASGQVTAVSLSIPWASRIAGSSSGTAAFAFTTQSDCTNITLTFPANFFVANTASCGAPPAIVVAGLPGFSLVGSSPTGPVTGPTTSTTFVFLPQSSQSLPAGSYVATFTSVTFGVATAGSDTGITVQTNSDSVSVGVPSGPLSGYQVTAFALPSCVASLSTCQSASVSFLSNAASIQAGSTLTITFSSTMPISGSPNQFVTSSGALVTGQVSGQCLSFRCMATPLLCIYICISCDIFVLLLHL